jgi:hypothetical protein
VLALQKKLNDIDLQLAYFTRYSSVHFFPDPVGDLVFNGVAFNVYRSGYLNGIQGDGAYRLNEAHTLRAGLRRQQELTLQIALRSALIATPGPTPPAVGQAYERARRLWKKLDRPSHLEPMLPPWSHHFLRGELQQAHQIATGLVQIGTDRNDVALGFIGALYLANTCLHLGKFIEARALGEQCLVLYDPVLVPPRLLYNGPISALVVLSRALFCLGYPD